LPAVGVITVNRPAISFPSRISLDDKSSPTFEVAETVAAASTGTIAIHSSYSGSSAALNAGFNIKSSNDIDPSVAVVSAAVIVNGKAPVTTSDAVLKYTV